MLLHQVLLLLLQRVFLFLAGNLLVALLLNILQQPIIPGLHHHPACMLGLLAVALLCAGPAVFAQRLRCGLWQVAADVCQHGLAVWLAMVLVLKVSQDRMACIRRASASMQAVKLLCGTIRPAHAGARHQGPFCTPARALLQPP